jgi:hypothetical protein
MTAKQERKLKILLASIICEQAMCEMSGKQWAEDKLKELDMIFSGLNDN